MCQPAEVECGQENEISAAGLYCNFTRRSISCPSTENVCLRLRKAPSLKLSTSSDRSKMISTNCWEYDVLESPRKRLETEIKKDNMTLFSWHVL